MLVWLQVDVRINQHPAIRAQHHRAFFGTQAPENTLQYQWLETQFPMTCRAAWQVLLQNRGGLDLWPRKLLV